MLAGAGLTWVLADVLQPELMEAARASSTRWFEFEFQSFEFRDEAKLSFEV